MDKKCGGTEWTDGRRQNYIPPTLSGDNKALMHITCIIITKQLISHENLNGFMTQLVGSTYTMVTYFEE